MPPNNNVTAPSLRARWLGDQMRRLREERGLTIKYVAAQVGVEFPVVSHHERGLHRLNRDRVAELLDLYGVHERFDRDRMLQLAQDTWRLEPWEADFDSPVFDPSMVDLLWLESRAAIIRIFGAVLMPILLQSARYVEAVFRWSEGSDVIDGQLERWRRLHAGRREVLNSDTTTALYAVLDEAVLHRQLSTPGAHREQLDHLVNINSRLNAQVTVLPTNAPYPLSTGGPFVLFELPPPLPQVACIEYLSGRLLLDGVRAEPYASAFDRLRRAALTPDESTALIRDIAKQAT